MAEFGTSSRKKLDTCDDSLVAICELAIEVYDFLYWKGIGLISVRKNCSDKENLNLERDIQSIIRVLH